MTDYRAIESRLTNLLHLTRRPVAVSFVDAPPSGTEIFTGSQPSGCSFWRLAADGRVIATVPSDHYNCPIGSYTHNIPLPREREQELPEVLGLMSEIGYIRMEEVGGIPRLPQTPKCVVYAPLGDTPVAPDAVLIAGSPAALMRLQEAAQRTGTVVEALLGRPTCMAIPAALAGTMVSSLGCIGNRVYTELADGDLYTVIAGTRLSAIADALSTIDLANAALTEYHSNRLATLRS